MIPIKRAVLYLLLLGLCPLVGVFMYSSYKNQELDLLSYEIATTMEEALRKTQEERFNKAIKKQYIHADHFYIDNSIEKIPLLQSETEELQKALSQGFHTHEAQLKQRLTQLTNGQNVISFVEAPVKNYKRFQETMETLARPVEVDQHDLAVILSRVEGIRIGNNIPPPERPDLIITELKLEKKKGPVHEAFLLYMKLLKREYK